MNKRERVRVVAGVKPFYSLTPEQADLVRVVAEMEASGIVATYDVLRNEMDCCISVAFWMAQGAAERGWLILASHRAPGVRIAPGAPLHRLFGSLKEYELSVTEAGRAALAGEAVPS